MRTRAYSICRTCASVYPDGMRCPSCHGDVAAARVVEDAIAVAVEARVAPVKPMRGGALVVVGVVAVSLIAGLGMLVLAFV